MWEFQRIRDALPQQLLHVAQAANHVVSDADVARGDAVGNEGAFVLVAGEGRQILLGSM